MDRYDFVVKAFIGVEAETYDEAFAIAEQEFERMEKSHKISHVDVADIGFYHYTLREDNEDG